MMQDLQYRYAQSPKLRMLFSEVAHQDLPNWSPHDGVTDLIVLPEMLDTTAKSKEGKLLKPNLLSLVIL
jgi:hypothetical protein